MRSLTVWEEIPSIIKNEEGLYRGDLVAYDKKFRKYQKKHPLSYHNLRHGYHVCWAVYQACKFYRHIWSPTEMRIMLIVALLHDIRHLGAKSQGKDYLNIKRAKTFLKRNLLPEDRPYLEEILELLGSTEVPYEIPSKELPLKQQVLREADRSQSLCEDDWIIVISNLADEWGISFPEILEKQEPHLLGLEFLSEWSQKMLAPEVPKRLADVKRILRYLSRMRRSYQYPLSTT